MESVPPASTGFVGSFRALGDGVLATVQDRMELFSAELHEEKYRLIQTLVWLCAVVSAGLLALAFASIWLVYLFWESARLAVLGSLAFAYAGLLVAVLMAFRRWVARQPEPFLATRQELAKDRACIRNGS
jgi:uncharacterized membrane protein YqjE